MNRARFSVIKDLVLCLLAAAAPCAAQAQVASRPYIEAHVGISMVSNPTTEPFVLDTFSGRVEGTFNNAFDVGGEAGWAGIFGNDAMRFGISWHFADIALESARIVGTINGIPTDVTVPKQQYSIFGINPSNNAHLVLANTYFDVGAFGSATPYVGLGLGGAFIENLSSEFIVAGTLGMRFRYGDNGYIGAQYRAHYIPGPTDDLRIQYERIWAHTFSLVMGVSFD